MRRANGRWRSCPPRRAPWCRWTSTTAPFARGGCLAEPYFLEPVGEDSGKVLLRADPKHVCRDCGPQQVPSAVENSDADQRAQALGLAPAAKPVPPPSAPVDAAAPPAR